MTDLTNQDTTTAIEPAAERITLALVETLRTIQQQTNGWNDVKVDRPTPGDADPITDAGIIVSLDSETYDEEGVPTGIEQVRATHLIVCDVVEPEDSSVLIETKLNRLKRDVKKTVRRNYSLGGLALDVAFKEVEIDEISESAHVGRMTIVAEVLYRTREDDPDEILNNPA